MPENFALPYYSGNSSGIGNTIFQETVEPLKLHLQNLKELDNTDDFWKMYKLKQDADAKKAKLAEDITKDLTVNPEGAMPEDIQNEFIPAMQDIKDRYAKVVGRLGGSNSNITRDPEYLKLMSDKNALMSRILQSKEHNKILSADVAAYRSNPDKFDDETLAGLATSRTKPLEERNKLITENGGTFLRPVTTSFTADVLKNSDNIGKYIYDVRKGSYINDKGDVIKSESKVLDPDKLRAYVKGDLANFKRAKQVDVEFSQLNPQTKAVYEQAAVDYPNLGTAKEQYAYDVHRNLFGDTKANEITGFSPERKEAAKNKTEEDKALYLYDVMNGILTGNLDYAANASKDETGKRVLATRTGNVGDFTSLDLKNMNYGTAEVGIGVDKETVPDNIVSVTINPNNPNFVKLKTVLKGEQLVDRSEFPEVLFNSNFGAGGYQAVKKAAEKRGHVSKSGAIVTPPINLKIGEPKVVESVTSSEGIVYPKKGNKKTIPTIKTKSEFDVLPSGSQYYNSKGILVTKG